ncbi:hypothetical protein LTR37_014453 [Vermiconidia calcicola]|uniref:Uncharacterized protein n=1 Tax=Vermiconidia calcicola TaxID=1690605 RepID=A0ACC3MTK2_9PEZI|nr:hypothetical protein LTR37_014453 [Vermiconidia calcicola]
MSTDVCEAAKVASEIDFEVFPWFESQCPPNDPSAVTQQAIDIYMTYQGPKGGIRGIGWWQAANGYTAIALHDIWSNKTHNYDNLAHAIRQCENRQRGLINPFNDDTCWWALLCVHMYSLKGDHWFLEKAEAIWRSMRETGSFCRRGQVWFRGGDMEGAVYWKKTPGSDHINAISTALYAELSARLALIKMKERSDGGHHHLLHRHHHSDHASAEACTEAARCSLSWILRCRYRPHKGIVLDHLELKNEEAVDWTFTYNTGVALGTCALLYEATREDEYMTLACHMAHRSMTHKGWVEDNGVLTEKGSYGRGKSDPLKSNNSVGFKAVLIRQLCTLYDVIMRTSCPHPKAPEMKDIIKKFIEVNYASQIANNTDGKGQYGPWWNGPFEFPTSHSQMAALDVMAAIVCVNRA